MKELLFGFLAKTLNMAPEQLAELLYKKSDDGKLTEDLNDGALAQLLQLDTDRVGKLKPDTKEIFNNGFKKAESEISGKWEKSLREKFGVDAESALQGDGLLDAIKAAMADTTNKPDKIKVSKEYLELESLMKRTVAELEAKHKGEIEHMQAGHKREQTWNQVASHIRTALQGLNPVLPADQAKSDRLINLFMGEFRDYDFEEDAANGGYIPMKDGARIQDNHGYARSLSDLVKERAETMFDFKEQGAAGNAGNQNGGGNRTVNTRFKDENDYLKQYNSAPDSAAKTALYEAWQAQTQAN